MSNRENVNVEPGTAMTKENEKLAAASLKASRYTKVAIGFLALVIAFSLAASSYALYDRFAAAEKRRTEQQILNDRFKAADRRQVEALRTVLCLARRQTATSRQRTQAEKTAAFAFYDEALMKIHAKPCKKEPA